MACFRSELGVEPKVKDLQDLDALLAELSLLKHYSAEFTAACSRSIDDVRANYQAQMTVTVGRSDIDLATREKLLVDTAEKWCRKHLQKHLPEGERSLKLSHGTVGFKAQPEKVTLDEGLKDVDVIERIEKKVPVWDGIQKLLAKLVGSFTLGTLIRIPKPELNRVAIKSAWQAAPTRRATLTELGISVKAGEDLVVLEPTEHRVAKSAS